ncbi:MAG TPA: YgaP-like transmembrane domain [Thermoanaerobaculia bacterium]|nr:YgaP-like transmembrane domain [Thermoanaerobaculia bacterium]
MSEILGNIRGQGNRNVNVGKVERWASVLGGAALAAFALRRRSKGAMGLALAGAPLIWRGATGHCSVYQKLGIDRVHGNRAADHLTSSQTNLFSQEPARTTEPIHGNEREYFSTLGAQPAETSTTPL